MKKLRFQVSRDPSRRRKQREPDGRWVVEPLDVALWAAVLLVVLWVQWLLSALAP